MWFSGSYDLILFIKKVNYIYLVCVGVREEKERERERSQRETDSIFFLPLCGFQASNLDRKD